MPRAIWKDHVIARSERCIRLEGNWYFPATAVDQQYLRPSTTHTVCPWKGTASYYDVIVGSEVNKDAAWFYPEPKVAAQEIKDCVAFWRGVTVED